MSGPLETHSKTIDDQLDLLAAERARAFGRSARRFLLAEWTRIHVEAGLPVPPLPSAKLYVGSMAGIGVMKIEKVYR